MTIVLLGLFTNYVINHCSLHRVGVVWAVLGHSTALHVLPGAVEQAEVLCVVCSAVQVGSVEPEDVLGKDVPPFLGLVTEQGVKELGDWEIRG